MFWWLSPVKRATNWAISGPHLRNAAEYGVSTHIWANFYTNSMNLGWYMCTCENWPTCEYSHHAQWRSLSGGLKLRNLMLATRVVSTLNIIPLKTFGCCIECVRPTRKMAARDARFLSSITGRQRPKKTVSMGSIVGSAFTTFALTAWLAASFPKGRRCKSFAINS
jgi:hypothetical protein